jgi:hypothetical protein
MKIFLPLFAILLGFSACAAGIVAWAPRFAESISCCAIRWWSPFALVLLFSCGIPKLPAAWQPNAKLLTLAAMLVAIPVCFGLLFEGPTPLTESEFEKKKEQVKAQFAPPQPGEPVNAQAMPSTTDHAVGTLRGWDPHSLRRPMSKRTCPTKPPQGHVSLRIRRPAGYPSRHADQTDSYELQAL